MQEVKTLLKDKLAEYEKFLKAPEPLRVLQNYSEQSLDIDNKTSDGSSDKFQGMIFINCRDTQININPKTVKLVFLQCHNCTVHVGKNVIGAIEVIRSSDLAFKLGCEAPLIQIDLSCDIHFDSASQESFYIATSCMNIDTYSQELKQTFQIPCTMFEDQTLCILNSEGFNQCFQHFQLNSIEQMLFFNH